MGNESSNPDSSGVKKSLTASQLAASKMIMSSRKVDTKPAVLRNNFSEGTTEVEKLLELAGLYQLTKNEFEPYGLLSPFNCGPFASSMREAGQEFEESNRRFVNKARDRINRLQRRTRRTMVQDLNVTTELDGALFDLNRESDKRQLPREAVQPVTYNMKKQKKQKEQDELPDLGNYLPPPPSLPSPPPPPLTQPPLRQKPTEVSPIVPQSPILRSSPQVNSQIGNHRTLEAYQLRTEMPAKNERTSNSQPPKAPRQLSLIQKQQHLHPDEYYQQNNQEPYDVNEFEPYSDDDDERPMLDPKKMSSIMEHSMEDDSEYHHEGNFAEKDPSPPSQFAEKRISKKGEEGPPPQKKPTEMFLNVPTSVGSPRPNSREPTPLGPQPNQSHISLKMPNKQQEPSRTPKATPRAAPASPRRTTDVVLDKHLKQLSQIDQEIKEAEDNFYRLLGESIDFESILQKYKLPSVAIERQQPHKKYVMGHVIDMPILQ